MAKNLYISIFLTILIGITLITSSLFQTSSNNYYGKSFLNSDFIQYVYAGDGGGGDGGGGDGGGGDGGGGDGGGGDGDDGGDDGGDEKDDDKDEKDEEKDKDSTDDSNNDETSKDSNEEKTEPGQKDVSDTTTTTSDNKVEKTTESPENDVSEIASMSAEETPETTPKEPTVPQETSSTGTPSLAAVTDKGRTPEAITEGISENQESNQDPEINEAKVLQIADKITENLIQEEELPEGAPTDIKNLLYNELKNNPDGELSKSLEALAGMESFVFEDEASKKIAERIIAKYPNIDKITSLPLIVQAVSEEVGKNWNKIIDITIKQIYDDKGKLKEKILTEIAGKNSYESKSDKQDIDCDDIKEKNIKVPPGDPNDLDRDGDGIGCEANNDDYDDNKNYHYVKKIIKYQGSKCNTQSGSVPLNGKIPPKTPILLGDFYPCILNDGRAALNLPNTQNLQFAMMHLDRKDGNHEAAIVDLKKIKNMAQNNVLFQVEFNDQVKGKDPITGKSKTITDVNAIALYNKSQQTIDFKTGNSLAISAILKS